MRMETISEASCRNEAAEAAVVHEPFEETRGARRDRQRASSSPVRGSADQGKKMAERSRTRSTHRSLKQRLKGQRQSATGARSGGETTAGQLHGGRVRPPQRMRTATRVDQDGAGNQKRGEEARKRESGHIGVEVASVWQRRVAWRHR